MRQRLMRVALVAVILACVAVRAGAVPPAAPAPDLPNCFDVQRAIDSTISAMNGCYFYYANQGDYASADNCVDTALGIVSMLNWIIDSGSCAYIMQ